MQPVATVDQVRVNVAARRPRSSIAEKTLDEAPSPSASPSQWKEYSLISKNI